MKQCLPILFFIGILGCKHNSKPAVSKNNDSILIKTASIKVVANGKTVRINSGNRVQVFEKKNLPLKNAVCVPTSGIAYMDALGLNHKILGVANPNYIYNPAIQTRIEQGKIKQIANGNQLLLEELFILQPEIVISSSNPSMSRFHHQLESQNIPIIYLDEYLEKTPLAKAEIVKLFGILFGKEETANRIFDEVKHNYNRMKDSILLNAQNKPKVIAGIMYGDIWYAPGSESFPAQFLKDAGADYLWQDSGGKQTLNLSFEEVYESAENSDFWLNAADFESMASLKSSYQNYEWFAPFKAKKVYNFSRKQNRNGANDYFETGIVRPDRVLQDLITILHSKSPEQEELIFYKHLN